MTTPERGLEKVNGEFALIMTVYNLKRTITLFGIEDFKEKIKNWKPDYPKVSLSLKSQLNALLVEFLDYFGKYINVLKLETILNRIQVSSLSNRLNGSEMDFFGKSNSFFTV